jgi:hypothetical protein
VIEMQEDGQQKIKYNLDKDSSSAGHIGIYIGALKSLIKLIPATKWLHFSMEMTSKKIAAPLLYKNFLNDNSTFHEYINNKYTEISMLGASIYLALSSKESLLALTSKAATRFVLYQELTKYKTLAKEYIAKLIYDQGAMDGELVYHLPENKEANMTNLLKQIQSSKFGHIENDIYLDNFYEFTSNNWELFHKLMVSVINKTNTCPNDFNHVVLGERNEEYNFFYNLKKHQLSFFILTTSYVIYNLFQEKKERAHTLNLDLFFKGFSALTILDYPVIREKPIYPNSTFCYPDQEIIGENDPLYCPS